MTGYFKAKNPASSSYFVPTFVYMRNALYVFDEMKTAINNYQS